MPPDALNLRSRTALRCGSTARSVWFNQMGTTSKGATVRMTKNSTNAEIWTQVGYFSDTPRILQYVFIKSMRYKYWRGLFLQFKIVSTYLWSSLWFTDHYYWMWTLKQKRKICIIYHRLLETSFVFQSRISCYRLLLPSHSKTNH